MFLISYSIKYNTDTVIKKVLEPRESGLHCRKMLTMAVVDTSYSKKKL